jgi:hypothetical protein
MDSSSLMLYRLIGLVIAAAIAFYVYQDAKKRGMNAIGWAIGTFLLCIIFLPVYLIMRKPVIVGGPPTPPYTPPGVTAAGARFCSSCGASVPAGTGFCPQCGTKVV